ncbi:thiol reductant ABC exporter subunit CydD [Ancylobacter pratisalsi]|uniref:Thiol reductant ABC exporter subunit CydD n=1 Tax=Ancylobacter pratisalsi TaxID=1745854 RepID=A0A6P1YT18_9HYPH|nr:thiol reductant ABC exporter subunit CydD [Ancylobacter pratisalsi]QIB35213.1 thiol reductant ABC exporter subunit CydD [Ancylobacter pratisalsi]
MTLVPAVPADPSDARSSAARAATLAKASAATARGGATARGLRRAIALQIGGALLWLPQAGLLAMAVAGLTRGEGVGDVALAAAAIAVLGIARAMMEAAGGRLAFRSARAELSRLRAQAAQALALRSPLDTRRPASGRVASALAEQAEAVVPYLSRFVPARKRATVVPLVILACVLPFSWLAALMLAVAAPLIPLFMALIGWQAKAASEAQLVELGGMNAFLLDRLRGMATIRSFGAVDATATRLRREADSLRARTMVVLRIAFLSSAVLELFSALGVAMVAAYVGFHLLGWFGFGTWGHEFGLAQGLFILLVAPAFFEPLRELSAAWHDRAAGQAALEALETLAEGGTSIVGSDAPPRFRSSRAPAVAFDAVGFRHAGQAAPLFEAFALDIAPGEHVALFAPSGAGKSSLLALIAGLVAPEAGRVSIDGEVMGPESAARLRAGMAYIGQQPHIFAGTLKGNVALGRPEVDGGEIARALTAVRLEKVAAMRGPAPIGEGGRGLSGGEGLRLALARLAATPQAGLILADEPTAHLDAATAREVTDALMELARGRTLVIATHDPALAARMDRVIPLEGATGEAGA